MKKYLLILGLTAIFTALPACAEFTVEDGVSRDYLKNHGYSNSTVRAVEKSMAQTSGVPLAEDIENPYYERPVIKQVRRFFMYLDPALDEHSFMNDHNVNSTTRYDDL